MLWHSVWISAEKLINTELHRIMKKTRNVYHLQIRKNKKLTENLKKNAFLNACISNKGDIFKLIRKERASSASLPSTIDGDLTDIANHLASIYKKLYNSADDDIGLSRFKEHLWRKVDPSGIEDTWRIITERVQDEVHRLKNDKTDPVWKMHLQSSVNNFRCCSDYF